MRINSPIIMRRRFEAAHRVTLGKAGAAKSLPSKERIVSLETENTRLKERLRDAQDGGSLYDLRKTSPEMKARIHLENAGLEKTVSYRNALTKVIDAAKKRKAQPAG